ncbi:hypothetical protein CMI37_17005 [Candidatus Pacearchaeota archaeon]|nr:hypothetical protein [Candidatus Pacearchaeota archaeon]|tara:strand:- start:3477 stop:3710 length:234 start_codon:yes stop_codon:yes gene_type:complete
MSPEERKAMLQLFKANPVLTTEGTCVKQIFQYALKTVVDDTHSELTELERIEIFSETLLEVEDLITEITGKTTSALN